MYDIKGRIVIITGSAQGMGKEFAKRFLENGAKVCLSDIDEIKGNETKKLFQKEFGINDNAVCFVKCDVSNKEDWPKLWNSAEIFLKGPIEILVNNAGLNPSVSFTLKSVFVILVKFLGPPPIKWTLISK